MEVVAQWGAGKGITFRRVETDRRPMGLGTIISREAYLFINALTVSNSQVRGAAIPSGCKNNRRPTQPQIGALIGLGVRLSSFHCKPTTEK